MWLFLFSFYLYTMPNSYFQFKQFLIQQDQCAMKVCTDSCLFGAWIPLEKDIHTILDIGTGTALLSLMLAQRSDAEIDSIEIEDNAYRQAEENISISPWKDRIRVHHGDIRDHEFDKKFDLIICNPPFYEKEMRSDLYTEKIAKHSLHLSLEDLLRSMDELLKENGKFAILLPYYRKEEFEKAAAEFSFYPANILLIKPTPKHVFFRYASVFSKNKRDTPLSSELTIKADDHYSPEATALLSPYYLYL